MLASVARNLQISPFEANFAEKGLACGFTRRRAAGRRWKSCWIHVHGEDAGSTQEIRAAHWGDAGRRSRRRGRGWEGGARKGRHFQQLAIGVQRAIDGF